jgi:hypothetical protein
VGALVSDEEDPPPHAARERQASAASSDFFMHPNGTSRPGDPTAHGDTPFGYT